MPRRDVSTATLRFILTLGVLRRHAPKERCRTRGYTLGGADWPSLFRRLDKDGSGGIEERELAKLVRTDLRIPIADVDDAQVSLLFEVVDVDGNGRIDLSELLAFVAAEAEDEPTRRRRPRPQAAATATAEQLKVLQSRLHAAAYTMGGKDWPTLFKRLDKDGRCLCFEGRVGMRIDKGGDGSGGVEEKELLKLVRTDLRIAPTELDNALLSKLFRQLDRDGSGRCVKACLRTCV